MRVRLLGPVDVVADGELRAVAGLRRKAVLAVLALHPGEVVGADRLIDLAWADRAPGTARNTLQRTVSYLRSVVGEIAARPPGYRLEVPSDLQLAEQYLHSGRIASTAAASAASSRPRACRADPSKRA